jgi:HSP20 family molecular chaperone IbpA
MLDFIKQVSVGYDSLMREMKCFTKEIEPDYNSPYNILKKDGKYQVQFYIPGIKQEDVFVGFEGGILTIEAGKEDDSEHFLYRSVFNRVIKTKLMIARHLDVDKVEFTNGVLYIDFIDLLPPRRDRVIMSGMHVSPPAEPVVVPVVDIPVTEAVVVEVVNAETEKPTVEVIMPLEVPQVVEIVDVVIKDEVPAESTETKVEIELADATGEVKTDEVVETIVVETNPEDASNIVVVAPVEVIEKIEAAGVDIAEVIGEAVNHAFEEEKVSLPIDPAPVVENWTDEVETAVVVETKEEHENIVFSVPDTIPQIVELVKVEDNKFEIVPVEMNDFKEDDYEKMIPVVTGEESPDVMVAVSAEVKEEMEIKIEEALPDVLAEVVQEVAPMVVTTVEMDPLVMTTEVTETPAEETQEPVEVETSPSEEKESNTSQ